MRLALLSATDPRPARSPVWSLQNLQCSKRLNRSVEIFGGIKNLLNWTPARNVPFLIARSHDPFDKKIEYEADGRIKPTPENPYGLSFDPAYVYAPNQGRRVFAGIRLIFR
jgi:outer membrane receptor for ferrienterochelin and colicins